MVKPLFFNDLQFRGGVICCCVFVATAVLVVRVARAVLLVRALVADSVSAVAISEPVDFIKLCFM
jgi:hypothetical protein